VGFSEALEVLELIALAVIVGLLYQLLRECRLLRRRIDAGREKKDGQTINVNLTPASLPESKIAPVPQPAKAPEPEKPEEPQEPEEPPLEPEPEPAPPKPIHAFGSVSVTPGGAIAIKCPKCGSENSSYRTECFNCGAALR
jgi:hypothetical protein